MRNMFKRIQNVISRNSVNVTQTFNSDPPSYHDGPSVVRERTVQPFTGIRSGLMVDLQVRVDPSLAHDLVTIKAPESMQDRFVTELVRSTLVLRLKDGSYSVSSPMSVTVNTRTLLSKFEGSGMGRATIRGVQGDRFDVEHSGMGALELDFAGRMRELSLELQGQGAVRLSQVDCETMDLRFSGMGALRASGKAGRAIYELAGMGEVDLDALQATDVELSSSGMGNVRFRCVQSCTGESSGMGSVRVYGNPPSISVVHTGMGSFQGVTR